MGPSARLQALTERRVAVRGRGGIEAMTPLDSTFKTAASLALMPARITAAAVGEAASSSAARVVISPPAPTAR